jgi:hypothetical protein
MYVMSIIRFVFVVTVLGCGGCGGSSTPAAPDASDPVAGPPCTGAVYDTCATNDQCGSQLCHLYNAQALQICTQVCSAAMPCPNDASGAAVACNQMGNCKPAVANNCHR